MTRTMAVTITTTNNCFIIATTIAITISIGR